MKTNVHFYFSQKSYRIEKSFRQKFRENKNYDFRLNFFYEGLCDNVDCNVDPDRPQCELLSG